jgi:hypothetical protein
MVPGFARNSLLKNRFCHAPFWPHNLRKRAHLKFSRIAPWWLHRDGKPTGRLRKALISACKRAGAQGQTPHDFRKQLRFERRSRSILGSVALSRWRIRPVLRRAVYADCHRTQVVVEGHTVGFGKLFQRPNRKGAALLDAPQLPFRSGGFGPGVSGASTGTDARLIVEIEKAASISTQPWRMTAPELLHQRQAKISWSLD